MIIVVNSAATRTSGALSIYKQFISHIEDNRRNDTYFIFVDPSMPQPCIEGVKYIHDGNHSWLHRIYWDYWGCRRFLQKHNVEPDIIVSLQNSGVVTHCRQVIYYHQPLPFYKKKWSFHNPLERKMALYKYIYPIIIKPTLNDNTNVVVQIPFIKKGFIKRFGFPDERVQVLFPDTERIDIANVELYPLDRTQIHFLYPATYLPYKEHMTIVESLTIIKKQDPQLSNKILVHLTLTEENASRLFEELSNRGLLHNIAFDGRMSHDRLLSLNKSADCLLFPSTIETLGLPLLEAAKFGLPIIVSDLDYSREVLNDYSGANFVAPYDFEQWAKSIIQVSYERKRFVPIQERPSEWDEFFKLIHK